MRFDPNKIHEVAHRTALKSSMRFKVSCVLVDSRGRIVSVGYNHRCAGTRLGRYSVHAEKDALDKVTKPAPNLYAFVYRLNGRPINCCDGCMAMMKAYEIRGIYYMTSEGWLME